MAVQIALFVLGMFFSFLFIVLTEMASHGHRN